MNRRFARQLAAAGFALAVILTSAVVAVGAQRGPAGGIAVSDTDGAGLVVVGASVETATVAGGVVPGARPAASIDRDAPRATEIPRRRTRASSDGATTATTAMRRVPDRTGGSPTPATPLSAPAPPAPASGPATSPARPTAQASQTPRPQPADATPTDESATDDPAADSASTSSTLVPAGAPPLVAEPAVRVPRSQAPLVTEPRLVAGPSTTLTPVETAPITVPPASTEPDPATTTPVTTAQATTAQGDG